MRAMTVVPGQPSTAAVSEVPEPVSDEGAVLVEGLAVGVCGTDREIVRQGYGVPPPDSDRLVLGHESLGRVVDAPEGAWLARGDLVCGIVRRPDPLPCPACARGQWDYCRNGRYTERGIKARDGYGAQRWRVDTGFAVPVPADLGLLGVLVEPTSVVAKAWEQVDRVGDRAWFQPTSALIIGAGPVGLLAAMLAVQRGLDVTVLDRVSDGPKPGLVADLGARYVTSLADASPQPEVVIECTGVGSLVLDVLSRTPPAGVVVLAGISASTHPAPVNVTQLNAALVLNNAAVVGSVNAARPHYIDAVEALLRADRGWLERLLTRRVPLSRWPDALDATGADVKVVVDLSD